MKEIILETNVKVFEVGELSQAYKELTDSALSAAEKAYAPYSNFQVGAAVLLGNGVVVTGSNQENAAYPSGLCAERVALFQAGANYPDQRVEAMAVAAISNGKQIDMISPCGACRQVMLETENRYNHPFKVLLCGAEKVYLIEGASTLLPISFDGSDLPQK